MLCTLKKPLLLRGRAHKQRRVGYPWSSRVYSLYQRWAFREEESRRVDRERGKERKRDERAGKERERERKSIMIDEKKEMRSGGEELKEPKRRKMKDAGQI